jgi:hypothetical protein
MDNGPASIEHGRPSGWLDWRSKEVGIGPRGDGEKWSISKIIRKVGGFKGHFTRYVRACDYSLLDSKADIMIRVSRRDRIVTVGSRDYMVTYTYLTWTARSFLHDVIVI